MHPKKGYKNRWLLIRHLFSVTTLLLVATYWASITNLEILTNAPGKVIPIGNVRKYRPEGGIIREVFTWRVRKLMGEKSLLSLRQPFRVPGWRNRSVSCIFEGVSLDFISSPFKRSDFSDEISTNYPELISNGKAQLAPN